ncbi:uncharacterized protein [Gorilla gorilla gorilla]|uniref:uncharacterized protein n=1 Tax=Gorilla gorilla gorilla TaxID=9595 RepID=UPI003008FFF2
MYCLIPEHERKAGSLLGMLFSGGQAKLWGTASESLCSQSAADTCTQSPLLQDVPLHGELPEAERGAMDLKAAQRRVLPKAQGDRCLVSAGVYSKPKGSPVSRW